MSIDALKRIVDPAILYEKIKQYWLSFVIKEMNLEPRDFDVDYRPLEMMSEDKHTVHLFVNFTKFLIEFIGKNIEDMSGYTQTEFLEQQFALVIRIIKLEHALFFVRIMGWAKQFFMKNSIEERRAYVGYCICGLQFRHKNGQLIKVFMRLFPCETSESGHTQAVIIKVVDVTSMMKSDDYWTHMTVGKNRKTATFFSKNQTDGETDLISEREMDVLKLVAEGFSTKEIAEKLFISHFTVEQHRKNMISRVGVRDSHALVEICRQCRIL